MLWARLVFSVTLAALGLVSTAFAEQTFPLNEPLLEDVPFCSEEKALAHIASVIAKGGDPSAIHEAYVKAGVCGEIAGAITYIEQVAKIGKLNVYKAKVHTLTIYVATTMHHDQI